MSNQKYLTFLYHEAVDDPSDSGFQRNSALPYKHRIQEFYDNIDIISRLCNNIITIDQLHLHNEATLLTFDDGGKSSILIADYLEKYDLRGHFFITTSLIGDKYFLSEAEIRDLHNRGHIIGSHSHSHPNVFKSLSYENMILEWSTSKKVLENILKTEITTCSIPGGDANKNSYISAQKCGYKFLFDSEPTIRLRKKDNLYILGRICPKAGTSYEVVEGFCNYKGIRKQNYIRKVKNLVKTIVFPVYSKIHNAREHEK